MHYLHDFRVGDTISLGETVFSSDEAREFAERYDPQPRNLDDSIAGPLYGGQVASGWQVAAAGQGLLVSGLLNRTAHLGVPEVRELTFVEVVRPGTRLRADCTIVDVNESADRPDRGEVLAQIDISDDSDKPVLHMLCVVIIARKPRN